MVKNTRHLHNIDNRYDIDNLEERLQQPKKVEPLSNKDYTLEFCYDCNTDRVFHSEAVIPAQIVPKWGVIKFKKILFVTLIKE